MTTDDKYSLRNGENLPQPIQMQAYRNLKTFSKYFAQFLESTSNLKPLIKKCNPRSLCVLEVTDCERHV